MIGFKQTEIGLVPESWDIVPLEQTGEVVYGIQAAVANLTKPIGTKILTNINITFDGKINLNQLRYYPLTKARHFKTVLKKGDILFNWRSGSKDHVGKTAFFDLDGEFTHASFILRIRTNDKVVNKYLFYYLTYLRSSGYFRKLQNYSVNAKFNASAVNALPTAVPPYKEQQNITHILSKIQSAIETQENIIQTTTELKKALMQKLFTEGLNGEPQKETEIGKIPKSWEVKKIKEICEIGTGGTPNTKAKEYYEPPEINWLKSGDINGLYITKINNMISTLGKENSNANTLYPPGSIMIAMSGRGKTRGTTAVLKVESTCSQSVAAIVPKKEINSEFLHFSLQYRYYEIRNITGHADRSGLNLGLIGNIKVFVPLLKDQEEIAKILLGLERKIQIASKKQESLRKLFKSMLHHLMTGQIRVKDLMFS